jgi:hypothetical protein
MSIMKPGILIFAATLALFTLECSDGKGKSSGKSVMMALTAEQLILPDRETMGLAAADFILSLQNSDGRIADCPGSAVVNEDSNMEYACIGLAAAYRHSGKTCYRDGLEKGITWLAARQEMTDPFWKGSWFYAYDTDPPYGPVALSPGPGIDDVRGVDATSALFVYLLYLHSTLTGDTGLSDLYRDNACAALDFLLAHNYDAEKYFYSSWQKSSGAWALWKYRYAADQADVYLGLRAGYLLYGTPAYGDAADFLKATVPAAFYNADGSIFATGMEEDGSLDTDFDGFNTIFSQGYLGWVFGPSVQTENAYAWLKDHIGFGGGLICYAGDPGYSLSVAVLGLAAKSLVYDLPVSSFRWVAANTFDPHDGGIRDTRNRFSEKYVNVAGLTTASMLGFPSF